MEGECHERYARQPGRRVDGRAPSGGRTAPRSYEPRAAKHDWSALYGAYIVARERGKTSDDAARDATLRVEASREHAQK